MASSKSKARVAAQQRARAQAKKAAARTAPAVRATPTSSATRTARPAASGASAISGVTAATARNRELVIEPEDDEAPSGTPLWFQLTTFVLAIIGLGISAYETYAHYNGSHLLGCASNLHATFDCTAVITSSQSMVFGVIPVAILGLAFYVAAVPLFSPLGWRWKGDASRPAPAGGLRLRLFRITRLCDRAAVRLGLTQRGIGMFRLGSVIVGMGFVMYLIYAEVYQIGNICEYCTGVHVVTFLLFCMTLLAAALWGLGDAKSPRSRD
jgi:uncharacterized membrane protein